MKVIAKLIIAGTIAGTMASAAGSVAAGSSGERALYPPVPKVNKNTAIPKKDPLAARPALAPKSNTLTGIARGGAGGGGTGTGEQGPRLGVERAAPERQIPDAPVAATSGPAGGNETE
ncbi:MAG: hypothetical protein O7I42_27220 [Alphaproteobacteria bacterium]|nr:hypothetical protein [Alphaproteobacteria bacterium]